jgi:cobalt-precorrin 5A hydrolase
VVVIDEAGRFVIPMLSGHLGGANALAGTLAAGTRGHPVLTTASDARQTLAVDLLGRELGWRFEASHDEVVRASAAVVNDEPVAIVQEAGSPDWWVRHANGRSGPLPANLFPFARLEDVDTERFGAVLWISHRALPAQLTPAPCRQARHLPSAAGVMSRATMRVALGLGCDRGTPAATLARAVLEALDHACGTHPPDVAAVASIDLKADEPGLLELARWQGWTIHFYPAAELAVVPVPNPSETVRRYTGTPSVSEAAALLAAGTGMDDLIIEKHKKRGPDGRNATVSIARIPQ